MTINLFISIVVALLLASCLEGSSGRRDRGRIADFSKRSTPSATPSDDYDCFDTTNKRYGNKAKYEAAITESGTIDSLIDDRVIDDNEKANQRSLADCPLPNTVRPTKVIYVNRDFCSCLEGKLDLLNNCSSFCAGRPVTNVATLYGSVTIGPEVELHPLLGNLYNWCNVTLNEKEVAPSCSLMLYNGSGYEAPLSVELTQNSNSFTVNLTSVSKNTTYVAHIVENSSGAVTTSFQIRRVDPPDDESGTNGVLKMMPVSQYTCLRRNGNTTSSGNYFNHAIRNHYFFPYNQNPPSLPPNSTYVVCHDKNMQEDDSPLLPRLELIPQVFSVWDQADARFYDVSPQNSKLDINDLIEAKLLEKGIKQEINFFGELTWPNWPYTDANAPRLGYYLQPWLNNETNRGFCPTQSDYNGNNPIFNILKELVGVETEAIFLALREAEVLRDKDGNPEIDPTSGEVTKAPDDILIIRESLLRQIWFYFENGTHYRPDDITANNRTIMFYWPPDPINPYIRKSTQKIYTVTAPENISQSAQYGIRTTLRPPDKRFGCVPKLEI